MNLPSPHGPYGQQPATGARGAAILAVDSRWVRVCRRFRRRMTGRIGAAVGTELRLSSWQGGISGYRFAGLA